MTEPLLRIEKLSKIFAGSEVALKNIDLTLPQGEVIGIVGSDGSGKTTLLRLIAALLKPTTGRIELLGCDTISGAEAIHAFSGYMPQRFGLYEELTVIQNLNLYASLRSLDPEQRGETFDKLLKFTGLEPFQKRRVSALSGGMKQKLGLACSLLGEPKVLILDEPTVGVDPISRRELWLMIQSLLSKGVSILWSTAYLNEAEKCQRVVLLKDGEILFEGPPLELTKRVNGRVFLIETKELRKQLSVLEQRDEVVDALIQGKNIRVVTKEPVFAEGKPTEPRLEDAFVDLAGGMEKGESKLSQAAPEAHEEQRETVVAKNLVKRFGSFTAVDDISFSVKKGEIFALLGPNGAGKSTTFKMLCGLLAPTSGTASVEGLDLQKASGVARGKIGYMAQKFSLYGNLTSIENLAFFSGIYGSEGSVEEKIVLSNLEEYRDTTAEILPAGIKQRLALAAALIHWPEILFLDEPTSGMDPISRRRFWSQMNGLARKGITILVSTHFMDEAENCDRIGLIYQGKMIHLDTPDRIKASSVRDNLPNPTLEDAFIQLIEDYNAKL
jgi:ABC-2 type transport system ATP-binding protein